jgi:TM2 domain-containing membrane protein YozV
MKRFIIIASLMLCALLSYAQSNASEKSTDNAAGDQVKEIVAGMKYKELKSIYDYKEWESNGDDRYGPGLMSVCSFLIPGLGQMICGEVGRGFGWLGGAVGCWAVVGAGAVIQAYGAMNTADPGNGLVLTGAIISTVAYLGLGTIEVCSIIDAARVAKVKNMYNQDLKKRNYSLNLYPSVDCIKMANGVQPTAGLTLAMRF